MNETEIQEREHRMDGFGADTPAVPVLLVIPARVIDRTLDACVQAVRDSASEHSPEILVVWDGAAGGEPCAGAVRQTHSPVLHSAAAARNHGASHLHQGILVFLDADVLVGQHTVDRLIEPILAGAAEATVGNYSLDVTGLNFLQSYKQLHVATVYGRRRGYIKSEFWTAIGAVRADVFHQLGGFNTGFRGACGEDTELGQRLTAAGYRVLAVPEATGRHLHRFTLATLVLNDLRKGTQTALQGLQHRNPLSNSRHSARPEVAAVFCAALWPVVLALGGVTARPEALAVGGLLGGIWIFARKAQWRVYAGRGVFFLARAVPLALLLDWVRGFCMANALWRFALTPTPGKSGSEADAPRASL